MSTESKCANEPRAYQKRREANARRAREFRKRHPGYNNKYVKRHFDRKRALRNKSQQSTLERIDDGMTDFVSILMEHIPPVTSATWRIIAHIVLAFIMAVVAGKVVG